MDTQSTKQQKTGLMVNAGKAWKPLRAVAGTAKRHEIPMILTTIDS